jgi:hypothetical protein
MTITLKKLDKAVRCLWYIKIPAATTRESPGKTIPIKRAVSAKRISQTTYMP